MNLNFSCLGPGELEDGTGILIMTNTSTHEHYCHNITNCGGESKRNAGSNGFDDRLNWAKITWQ
jgi:hypothetical protein